MTEQEMKKVQDEWNDFVQGKVSLKKTVEILKNIALNAIRKVDELERQNQLKTVEIESIIKKLENYEKSISDSKDKKATEKSV